MSERRAVSAARVAVVTWSPGIRRLVVYACVGILAPALYLFVARLQFGATGLPLDDAWIHQVYARNLAARGEFAFFAGWPSAGSTSPLWAILIAPAYVLNLDGAAWARALGVLCLIVSAVLGGRLARRLGLRPFVADWLVPLFLLLEWHLNWAALSGMEIPLFILLSLALLEAWYSGLHPLWLGLLGGLVTLTRPEGIVLAGLVGLGVLAGQGRGPQSKVERAALEESGVRGIKTRRRLAAGVLSFTLGFALLLAPYLTFNLQASGTILPNTFYAKGQEYGALLQQGYLLTRWLSLYRQPLLGGQILLVPGLLYAVWRLARARRLELLIPPAWLAALPALYAARLPVDYQFGRYEMPVIPFMGIYGIAGTAWLFEKIRIRVLRRAWGLAAAVLVVAFAWLGANEYGRSVAIIDCEMVTTAKWTAANLPAGALIAAHDIGAQGYFDSHPLLDLAGLVSPEVIPFIRDEARLADWIQSRGAKYAILFPTWYPRLAADPRFVPIHSESCAVTRASGEADLTVYEIR